MAPARKTRKTKKPQNLDFAKWERRKLKQYEANRRFKENIKKSKVIEHLQNQNVLKRDTILNARTLRKEELIKKNYLNADNKSYKGRNLGQKNFASCDQYYEKFKSEKNYCPSCHSRPSNFNNDIPHIWALANYYYNGSNKGGKKGKTITLKHINEFRKFPRFNNPDEAKLFKKDMACLRCLTNKMKNTPAANKTCFIKMSKGDNVMGVSKEKNRLDTKMIDKTSTNGKESVVNTRLQDQKKTNNSIYDLSNYNNIQSRSVSRKSSNSVYNEEKERLKNWKFDINEMF